MGSARPRSAAGATTDTRAGGDMKLEVAVVPVADVGRAADFYAMLGWRKDADIAKGAARVLQFTPPGLPCSIIFGTGLTPSAPGTAQYLHLIASAGDLAQTLRRAAAAHGQHETRTGEHDERWPDCCAEYMEREPQGEEPPV
jgi:hypothetical protein